MKILFLSISTTGLPTMPYNQYLPPNNFSAYENARLIEIAYQHFDETGRSIGNHQNELLKPSGNFVMGGTQFHGITRDMLNNGIILEHFLPQFSQDLDNVDLIVSYNVEFVIKIIQSELYRLNRIDLVDKIEAIPKYCVMENAKRVLNVFKFPRMKELYLHLFNEEIPDVKRAAYTNGLTRRCYFQMLQ